MLNIHDLERRWFKYKLKSYIPIAGAVTASIIFLIIIISISVNTNEEKPVVAIETPNVKSSVDNNITQDVARTATDIKPVETELILPSEVHETATLTLKPSLNFMDNIEDDVSVYIEEDFQTDTSNELEENNNADTSVTSNIKTQSQPSKITAREEKKSLISINSKKSSEDIRDVIRRFKKSKNPTLSLFVAKHYYKEGNYQKSYNYALMTNQVDQNIEESWVIFAKSLVKLGQPKLAAKTLQSYLKTNKSTTVTVLLRKIETGEFK